MHRLHPDIDFRVLGDEMARKRLGFENEDLELEKYSENYLNRFTNISKSIKIEKPIKSNRKLNPKINENDSELKMIPTNFSLTKPKKIDNQIISKNKKNEIEIGKIIQEGNSNIINTNTNPNTNPNTNLNTATNINSHSNTYMNININTNTNTNNNENENNINNNQNDINSEKNSIINQNSSSISNNIENHNENINENIDESEINIQNDKDITVEIVNPAYLNSCYDKSFADININVNKKLNINNKYKKSKFKKLTLYEREMKNQKRKKDILDKKKKRLQNNELQKLKECPEIDPISQIIIENQEIYIPIDKRAANIHSMKITQRILNEENNKIRKIQEEDELMNKYKNKKKFDKNEWDDFLERQSQWKDEIEYKIKAAEFLKNNVDKT